MQRHPPSPQLSPGGTKTGVLLKNLSGLLPAALLAALLACAPDMPRPGSGSASRYELLDASSSSAAPFQEPAWELDPLVVLPAEERQGEGFRVESIRYGPGFVYTYSILTENGELEARGRGRLRKRVREIQTLAGLKSAGVEDSDVYVLALANAAGAPAEGGMQLLFNPIRTTTNIPKGMWSMAQGYYEMIGAGRTYLEDDYFHELIGFSRAKREWAYRLGLDPYSANPQLQAVLDRLAWLSLAGGMTVRLPLIAVPGGASIALTVTNTSDDMKRELRDETPEEIRIRNRKILLETFSVEQTEATNFIEHPWYSPTAQLEIVDALMALSQAGNRKVFIELSTLADTPTEAYSFTRLALLFQAFESNVESLTRLFSANGLIAAETDRGNLVVPLNVDFGFWTQGAALFLERLDEGIQDQGPKNRQKKYALVSGSLSPEARSELQNRGWTVMENLEDIWLDKIDADAFTPAEPDPNRILPEIGS
ncbi:MAG: hypothetical protein P8Q97_18180 [Myxococcota bacterium]|jgi:hypothetical protein|nr:hypothetical protein [Myxococcota bacterium]